MHDIDDVLAEAGRRWRARQPAAPEPDVSGMATHRRPRWVEPLIAVAAVAAVFSLALAVDQRSAARIDSGATPGVSASLPSPAAAAVVRDGDPVHATGIVIVVGGGSPSLCDVGPTPDVAYPPGQEPEPECSSRRVEVSGLAPRELPGWTERDGVGWSAPVTLSGTWNNGLLNAATVARNRGIPEGFETTVPCDPPSTGWPRNQVEREGPADRRLALELEDHPELYSGRWIGYPERVPDVITDEVARYLAGIAVQIVGTVGDRADVEARLRAFYPGPLCVVEVAYSRAELEATAARLGQSAGAVDVVRNRVRYPIIVWDAAAAADVGADLDKVIVDAFVQAD